MAPMGKRIDRVGERYGRLVVLAFSHLSEDLHAFWLCRCDCGAETVAGAANLTQGKTRSCGCLRRDMASERQGRINPALRHGLASRAESGAVSVTYTAWANARARCGNPNRPDFEHYGGRGIQCLFNSVEALVADIGENPEPGVLSLDRIDNDGNYEVGNVRWATRSQQQRNKRTRG